MMYDFRYPQERRTLAVTLLVLLGLLGMLGLVSLGAFVGLVGLLIAVNYLAIQMQRASLMRNAVQVSQTQLADIDQVVRDAARVAPIPPTTQVFVVYSPEMNAAAFGVVEPYSVYLHSAVTDAMDGDELRFVVGHELGHIHFGHTRVLTLIGALSQAPGLMGFPLITAALRLLFLSWTRMAEFSADRAGLLASGRLDKALSALLKLSVGPSLASRVDLTKLAGQAREADANWLGSLAQVLSTHPFLLQRIQRLVEFARLLDTYADRPAHGARLTNIDASAWHTPGLAAPLTAGAEAQPSEDVASPAGAGVVLVRHAFGAADQAASVGGEMLAIVKGMAAVGLRVGLWASLGLVVLTGFACLLALIATLLLTR